MAIYNSNELLYKDHSQSQLNEICCDKKDLHNLNLKSSENSILFGEWKW